MRDYIVPIVVCTTVFIVTFIMGGAYEEATHECEVVTDTKTVTNIKGRLEVLERNERYYYYTGREFIRWVAVPSDKIRWVEEDTTITPEICADTVIKVINIIQGKKGE